MPGCDEGEFDLGSLRAIVVVELTRGTPTLSETARLAGVSVRTLQRRLGKMGTTYSGFLRDIRREAAVSMLRGTDMPVTAIAASLGFSELSAFSRAFRRWTGRAPSDLRRTLRG